jgi:hypothetical protein
MCSRYGKPAGGGREEAIPVSASIAAKEDGYQDSGEQTERQEE